MSYCKKIFLMFAVVTAVVSCVSSGGGELPAPEQGYGTLDVAALTADISSESAAVPTRAVSADGLVVRVVHETRGLVGGPWIYPGLPSEWQLPVGRYTIEVSSPGQPGAAMESPWYYGSKEITISDGQRTNPGTVTCTLANVKVTVRYSDDLKKVLVDSGNIDVTVEVSIGDAVLAFPFGEMRAGYLPVDGAEDEMTVTFRGTIEGSYDEYSQTVTVKPGEWERVRFTFEESDGARTFHIIIFDSGAGQITDGEDWF